MAGRPVRGQEGLISTLPRIRCTPTMRKMVYAVADHLNVGAADVMRACVAEVMQLSDVSVELMPRVVASVSEQVAVGFFPGQDEVGEEET